MEERIREEKEGLGEGGRGRAHSEREKENANGRSKVMYYIHVAQWYHVCHQRRGRRSMLWRYGTTDEESIYVF